MVRFIKKTVCIALMTVLCVGNLNAQKFVQKNNFKNAPEISGEVTIKQSTLKVEGDDSYNIFEIDVPQTGYYYLNAWMMIPRLPDGSFRSYDVLVNNTKSDLKTQAKKDNWQNVSITGNNNPVYLQQGINTISFVAKIPEVPNVEFIKLSLSPEKAAISEDNYNNYIADIEQESKIRSTTTLPPANPYADYDCQLNMTLKYTWYTLMYAVANTSLAISTTGVNGFSHIVHVFNRDTLKTPTQTWMQTSNSNGAVVMNVTIPQSGYYYVLIRSLVNNATGLVNINITASSGTLYQTNCPVAGTELRVTQGTSEVYNTFTACTTNNGDPMIWLVDGPSTPGKIVFYNDDYHTTAPHDFIWGYNARIKRKHTQTMYGVILSTNSSFVPTGAKTDLYVRCKNYYPISSSFPILQADDALFAAPASGAYNCISYSGGITNVWVWPPNPSSPYYVPGNSLASFDKFYSSCRYDGSRYYSRQGANYTNSGVDLWEDINDFTHASISKKADAKDHGYEFESKCGAAPRIFHPRHGLEQGLYGYVSYHYIWTGAVCKKVGGGGTRFEELDSLDYAIFLDESIANGWSVIENVEFTEKEKEKMANIIKSSLTTSEIEHFGKLYATWRETWKENELHSDPRMYAANKEYQELIECCRKKEKAGWCLIFEKYGDGDFLSTTAIEDLVLLDNPYNYELLQSILRENEEKEYDEKERFIVRNFYSNGMLFIKKLLQEMDDENPKSTPYDDDNRGIRYSNSDEFNVYPYSSSEMMINFSLDRDAKISLVILDLKGREVHTALNQRSLSEGTYQYIWDYTGNPSGLYLVRYVVNGNVNVKKVIIP